MTSRHTVESITSDALNALYEQLEAAQETELARQLAACDKAFASATVRAARAEAELSRVQQAACRTAESLRSTVARAEQAEAAIERVRELCVLTIDISVRVHARQQAYDTLAALDEPQQPTTTEARK
jgi:hypothetical protein